MQLMFSTAKYPWQCHKPHRNDDEIIEWALFSRVVPLRSSNLDSFDPRTGGVRLGVV